MRLGFIGLGNIGKPMAKHLAQSEWPLAVFDLVPEACGELEALGATVAETAPAVGEQADIIGLCVRNDDDVRDVLLGDTGLLSRAAEGTVVMIHSTVRRTTVLDMAEAGEAHGVHVIDAPITGGASGAEAGTLCYMVGGPATVLERVRPVLECNASTIVHAGDLGAGIMLKLCNNTMTYAGFLAIHEAAKLAEAGGLSFEVLKQVGQANGVITDQMLQFIEGRDAVHASCNEDDFRNLFQGFAALGVKDLQAALESADTLGIDLPGARRTRELIENVFYKAC